MTAKDAVDRSVRRHLLFGWSWLTLFILLGLTLEALHAFKVGWYLDLDNATRRLMWTLAHAHGVLVGLVHLAFATTLHLRGEVTRLNAVASVCLVVAGLLLPFGFLLGGWVIHQGDPGVGVFLVPIGGAMLLAAVVSVVVDLMRWRRGAAR